MKDDPSVKLPDSIKRQVERSKTAFDTNKQAYDAAVAEGVNLQPILPDGPVQVNPPQPEGTPPENNILQKEPPPAPEQPPQDVNWQARYDTLAGKYNAEVPAQARMIADLKRQLDAQAQQIAELTSRQVQTPPSPAENIPLTPKENKRRVTDDEIAAYTPDFMDVIGRRAEEVVEAKVGDALAPLLAKLEGIDKRVAVVEPSVQMSEADRFNQFMIVNVGADWEKQDRDPLFLDWLQQLDGFTGIQRKFVLDGALQRRDFARVATIFKGYLSEQGVVNPPALQPKQDTAPKVDLNALVAPGARTRSGSAPEPQAPQAISRAEIQRYYRDKMRGLYNGRDAEVAKIEALIAKHARDAALAT